MKRAAAGLLAMIAAASIANPLPANDPVAVAAAESYCRVAELPAEDCAERILWSGRPAAEATDEARAHERFARHLAALCNPQPAWDQGGCLGQALTGLPDGMHWEIRHRLNAVQTAAGIARPLTAQLVGPQAEAALAFCRAVKEPDADSCARRLIEVGRSSDKPWEERHFNGRFAEHVDGQCKSAKTADACTDRLLAGLPPGVTIEVRDSLQLVRTQRAEEEAAAAAEAAIDKRCKAQGFKRGHVRIGMTPEQARRCGWGEPNDVNRTTTQHSVREQWVYAGGYLYFTNGRLTAFQN